MEQLKRKKRSTSDEKNTCHLYIQTDHMLWNELGRSRDRVLAKISDHVKALNDVFRATVFHTSNNGKIRDIGFMVKRMVVSMIRMEISSSLVAWWLLTDLNCSS